MKGHTYTRLRTHLCSDSTMGSLTCASSVKASHHLVFIRHGLYDKDLVELVLCVGRRLKLRSDQQQIWQCAADMAVYCLTQVQHISSYGCIIVWHKCSTSHHMAVLLSDTSAAHLITSHLIIWLYYCLTQVQHISSYGCITVWHKCSTSHHMAVLLSDTSAAHLIIWLYYCLTQVQHISSYGCITVWHKCSTSHHMAVLLSDTSAAHLIIWLYYCLTQVQHISCTTVWHKYHDMAVLLSDTSAAHLIQVVAVVGKGLKLIT